MTNKPSKPEFKAQGPGWQSRINEVLKKAVA
jgi:uncharacterized protein (DUF4415 family)